MDSYTHCFLVSTVLMLLILNSNAANPPSKLVQNICKETSNPPNCLSALQPDPRTTSVSTFRDLAQIALQLAIANTTNSQTFIKNMLNSKGNNPHLRHAIQNCVSSYRYAIYSFRSALNELDDDPLTANYDAKVAGDGATNCEDGVASTGQTVAPISTRNQYLLLYSDIGYRITNKL
ncbi:PMEI domain-containing protein [Cephalotus follicularis]|uniref:PMEI domain-containing protein n=1 Tax=Cephalotus follicularis TaxID=3775 RepID=A0A1Q3DAW9_CEPFO|nr:PMEI domain-containing protein [Cephalotus follicularis]